MPEQEASSPFASEQRLQDPGMDSQMRALVAANPTTPGSLLELLASDPEEEIRARVASNPNTPWKILENLAREFPTAFLHNAMGPLQLIAYPEQVCTDEHFWNGLLRETVIPDHWWQWLMSHPTLSTTRAVRLHVQYAGETLYPDGNLLED